MHVVVVSWSAVAARARSTVQHALALPAPATVLDLDGSYGAPSGEAVLRPADLGLDEAELRRRAAALGAPPVARAAAATLVAHAAAAADVVLAAAPGVLLLATPETLVAQAREAGLALVGRPPGTDGRHPDVTDLLERGAVDPALVAVAAGAPRAVLDLWAGVTGLRWLDAVAAAVPHATVRTPEVLLGPWSLRADQSLTGGTAGEPLLLDGARVHALDLSALDAAAPWVLDPTLADPRGRLSDHPALARLVARETAGWSDAPAGAWDADVSGLGAPMDDVLRRAAAEPDAPDLLDPAAAAASREWLLAPAAAGGLPRYLLALHDRPDLTAAFPRVPGTDEAPFVSWARAHAVADGLPAELVLPAVERATVRAARDGAARRPAAGVNVVGFLGAELGIGESARQLVAALRAHGVPCSTTSVDRFSQSRVAAGLAAEDAATDEVFDTTVLCVNADLTPTVAAAVPDLLDRSYRVGMWYWEVEQFPPTQHGGFAALDEVWVATDFVRAAVEPHSPVPVRTLTPPLPQAGTAAGDRAGLGLPDRPYLLFSFDYLSTAERKNPTGLVAAFTRAFAPDEGPLLVLKSINADLRPVEAERLRLAAQGRPDVLLLEEHLPAAARDALVAHCAAYVSLHRSEGLGLTMAEAMAWGRPVIATGYSGNLQFMTEENSFLVPWRPVPIPAHAEPYPAGGTWAEPDLDEAARLLRLVHERPELAAARGARAARDIATLHNAEVAGAAIAARLDEVAAARRARARRALVSSGKQAVERLGRRLLR